MIEQVLYEWRDLRLAATLALCLALSLVAKADLATRDAISINISNDSTYTITGDGTSSIATLAGDIPDNAWQNTPAGNPVMSGDVRNGRVTGVMAYDASSKTATTLSDVMFTWAVEGSGVQSYGHEDIQDNPTFHKAWLARYSKAGETSSILVQSIPYLKYDVIVYCSGADESAFGAIAVNGVSYVGDTSLETETNTRKAASGSETWGGRRAEPILGQNAIRVNGLDNPELSLVIASGATSICAVQILRDMAYGIGPTTSKTISINLQSSKNTHGTTPAVYGLEPVPDAAWTRDGLNLGNNNANYDSNVDVPIKQWNGNKATELSDVVLHEKVKNAYYWSGYSYTPQNQILSGYADDTVPAEITVSGIPYTAYDVIVYCATDNENKQFGPVTVNNTPYRWNDATESVEVAESESSTESTRWGATQCRLPAYGRNALRISNQTSPTLTVKGANNANNARGGLAAIQIIEVKPGVGENDLEIAVKGDTVHAVTAAEAEKTGTVYLTGSGTLTLSGSAKISAATINIDRNVTLNIDADRLDATTFTGLGTVVYDGVVPPTNKGWTDPDSWIGTVWIKNKSGITGNGNANTGVQPNSLGNANSKVKFSGVSGWIEAPVTYDPEIVLENDGYSYALQLTNGNSPNAANPDRATIIKKLSGSGTLGCGGDSYAWPLLQIWDATGFTGSINTSNSGGNGQGHTGLVVVFCDENTTFSDTLLNLFKGEGTYPHPRTIYVASGTTVTQDSAATWTAVDGFGVDGTLVADGTIASSNASKAISGSGTVVFTGRAPTPTGAAWWKNAAWTGTVEIKDYSTSLGNFHLATYGNSESKVCMNGATGYLYSKASSGDHNIKELIIGAGGFTQNGGYSTLNTFELPCKVTGSGTYTFSATGNGHKTLMFAGDMSEFTGMIKFSDAVNAMVLIGSSTSREFVANSIVIGTNASFTVSSDWSYAYLSGGIFVDEGGSFTINSSSGYVDTDAGLTIDGTATMSGKQVAWGCVGTNTPILINDTGVLELVSTANNEDYNDYSGVTGTGTIKYSSTAGWRTFPEDDAKMPATTLTIQTELADSLIITKDYNRETVIGNLAGSKNIRSDWDPSGKGEEYHPRTLTVTQSKDTEWQGKFVSNRITQFNVVAPAAGSSGTLTLSGTQTESIPMQVDGKVNLTGTWVGNTTVAGTFVGTGTLTGNLTFNDGAVFKAGQSQLTVSGNVTASGLVTVDVSEIAEDITEPKLIIGTPNVINIDNFEASDMRFEIMMLEGGLGVQPKSGEAEGMEFGAINIPGTYGSPLVTIGDTNYFSTGTVEFESKTYSIYNIPANSTGFVVRITYKPDNGYVIVGSMVCEVEKVSDPYYFGYNKEDDRVPDPVVSNVVDLSEVAFITDANATGNTLYITLDDAVDAIKGGETLTLIKDAVLTDLSEAAFHISNKAVTIDGYGCNMGGNLKIGKEVDLKLLSGVSVTNDIIAMATATDATITHPTNSVPPVQAPEGYDIVSTDNGDGTATITFVSKDPEPEPEQTPVEDIIGIRLEVNEVIITTTPTNAVGKLIVSKDVAGTVFVEEIDVDPSAETRYDKQDNPSLFFRIKAGEATE